LTGTHHTRRLFRGILILFLLLAAAAAVYISDYSRASDNVRAYLQDTAEVAVREIPEGLFLDGPGTENALIFYPGGKVEYTAYLPLLHRLAEDGTDCFLVRMPANLAFLGINKAGGILEAYDYDSWYLAGRSLGGVAAAFYAADHDLNGLILADVDLADPHMVRVGMTLHGDDLTNHNIGNFIGRAFPAAHHGTGHGHISSVLLGGNVMDAHIGEIFQPTIR
jgi:hypothetical protein